MLTIRNIIDTISGFRFMIENLDIQSGLGKRYLYAQEFLYDSESIQIELDHLDDMLLRLQQYPDEIDRICSKLTQIRDIHGTVANLKNAATLDDIELFEIKHFSLLASEISENIDYLKIHYLKLPEIKGIIKLLDPENTNLPNFYIYSSYNSQLKQLREQYIRVRDIDKEESENIRFKCTELEDQVRKELSMQLFPYAEKLLLTLDRIAYIDVLIAKAKQAKNFHFSKPFISKDETKYIGLFNPQIKAFLQKKQKDFQALDICLHPSPCLVTGANMGGKTVLLKTIALTQYLFQFGFFVPAESADIVPVELIMFSLGDEQSELNGLSSFAAEMLNINQIIKAVKSGKNVLALIDELARTTNPEEGKAIVEAVLEILETHQIRSLITTHYSGLQSNCRKLKVKGLIPESINETITVDNINDFMDYSLIENTHQTASLNAINIAKILGVDEEVLLLSRKYLN